MPSVVIFGATGFVGAPLIRGIKKYHPDWPLTAYVRPGKTEEALKNIIPADRYVFGNFDEFDKIKNLSKEHDIAINAGNSFSAEPVAAIIAGLSERPSSCKGKLIHISGAGNFMDMGKSGNFNPDGKEWNDDNEDDIRQINKDMFNGPSDTVVLEAGTQGLIDTYIVCPSVIYGIASVGASGIGVGYNSIIGNAKPLGYVPYVGDGTAMFGTVHILDVVPFILMIAERAAEGPAEGSAYSRFYLLQTERVQWKQVGKVLAKILYDKGWHASPEPRQVPFEQAGKGERKYLVGANMLIKGDRAARMGFRAEHPSILEQMPADFRDVEL